MLAVMKKNDLFELIKTLSASEKKVFRAKHSQKEDGTFMRLFNAIESGKVKNDAEAKQFFAHEKFAAHLHKTKAYLYESILRQLHAQVENHFVRLEIYRHLAFAETLYGRKLIAQAEEEMQEALALAQKAEEFELEQFIAWQLAAIKPKLHQENNLLTVANQADAKAEEFKKYNILFLEAHQAYLQRGKSGNSELDAFYAHPLMQQNGTFKSKKAQRYLAITKSLLSTVARDYEAALQEGIQIFTLLQPQANTSAQSEIAYINALFNAILSKQGLQQSAKPLIEQLEKFAPVSVWGKSQHFVCLLRAKLNEYVTGKPTAEGKKLLQWIEKELPQYNNELNEQELIKLHISIAGLCLKEKEYNKALDYLLLFNQSKIARENRPVIYRVAMLYQLIAYYELKNFEWLATTLRNYKYFQQTNDAFYMVEEHTLEFLNKALRLPDDKSRKAEKENFVKQLKQAATNEYKSGLAYLESIDWVEGYHVS